jgi:AbrB family looped-hinge helix DNA binding protein
MAIAILRRKGQITLPQEVRAHFHLDAGDRLEFVIDSAGVVHVQPVAGGSYQDLKGIVRRRGRPSPSIETLDQELARLLVQDDQRIRRGGA